MARIRTIKPEFWTSGQVLECSTNARLMFIGLWNFSDDEGRHPYRPKQIKAQIFPSDDLSEKDILGMLLELSKNGLITTYTIDNEQYLLINGWHHQRIDKPQPAKYPPPLQDDSGNILGTFPPDRIGKDTIGVDTIGNETKGQDSSGKPTALPAVRKESVTGKTWESYSKAYEHRYRTPPVRNASVNAKLSQFVARIGIDESPEVAAFYVYHNNGFYVSQGHPVGVMLKDAEKLRTEWATNTQITGTRAKQVDQKQANLSVYQEVAQQRGMKL